MTADAFGFPLPGMDEEAQAHRAECAILAERDAAAWSQILATGKWPGETRLKDMIRKVRDWVLARARAAPGAPRQSAPTISL